MKHDLSSMPEREARNFLAEHIQSADVRAAIAEKAGISMRNVRTDAKPVNAWMYLLEEARNQGMTSALLESASEWLTNNAK